MSLAGGPVGRDGRATTRAPRLLYRPPGAWVGDVIPFQADGAFHIFHLLDDRDALGAWRGLDWAHLVTRDFVTYTELPLAVPRGGSDDLDLTYTRLRLPRGRWSACTSDGGSDRGTLGVPL